MQLRVRALETILTEKGYVEPAALDALIEAYETKVGPHRGARIVARAWIDPQFKAALIKDATAAIASLGMHGESQRPHHRGREHAAPAQHRRVHAVLVLSVGYSGVAAGVVQIGAVSFARGDRPARRAARISASTLPADTEIRVWDSTAETRFIVVPMRPAGTEGWSEEKLSTLVTRNSMIGTGQASSPGAAT